MTQDDRFDVLMESLDAPLAIVTTAAHNERAGCVVGFHTQCSIEPRRFAVWISKANHTYRVALLAEHLAIHLLTTDDHDLAELFGGSTGDEIDKFTRCEWTLGPRDIPVLDRCPHHVIARRVALLDEGGDHVCLVVEPIEVSGGRFEPLRISNVHDVTPGHPAEPRP